MDKDIKFVIIYLIFVGIFYLIISITNCIEKIKLTKEKKKIVDKLILYRKTYPNVCDTLIRHCSQLSKDELLKHSIEDLNKITELDTFDIKELQQRECYLIEIKEITKRKKAEHAILFEERRKRVNAIAQKYPDGFCIFKQRNPESTILNLHSDLNEFLQIISEYDSAYKKGKAYMFKREFKSNYIDFKQYLESHGVKYFYHFTDKKI